MQELCGKPLQFGDAEQIATLKKEAREWEQADAEKIAKERGQLRRFEITYSATVTEMEEIEALDDDAAEAKFFKKHRHDAGEYEIEETREV